MILPCRFLPPWPAAVLLLAAGPAPGLEYEGYVRAGAGTVAGGDGRQACFILPDAAAKYRLGNECETYGELGVIYGREADGERPGWRYEVMLSVQGQGRHGLGNVLDSPEHVRMQQNWLQVDLPAGSFLGGARVWLGRRYYRREDVHIDDFFYWNNTGPGMGIEEVALGPAKLAYAFRVDWSDSPYASDGRQLLSHDFRLYGLKDGYGGELTLGVDYKHAEGGGAGAGLGGYWLNLLYVHKRGDQRYNKFALQYGRGAGAGIDGHPVNPTDQSARTWRLVEQLVFQPRPFLSGMFALVYQDGRDSAGTRSRWFSIGARPMLHFDRHWNVATELGHDLVWAGGPRLQLDKLTVALQYSADRGFFARPVGRLFVTHAHWNAAAQAAAPAGSTLSDSGEFGSRTQGTTYGLQFETWF